MMATGPQPSMREMLSLLSILFFIGLNMWISRHFQISATQAALGMICSMSLLVCSTVIVVRQIFSISSPSLSESLRLGIYLRKKWWKAEEFFDLGLKSFRHILVTGVTGAGKSTFIRRFIQECLRSGHAFFLIDFKGERGEFEDLLKICESAGFKEKLQVFDLSKPEECLTCNFLTIFPEVEESVGFITALFFDKDSHPYFKTEAERFLRYSLQLLDAAKCPRSFIQIQEIFYNEDSRAALLSASIGRKEAPEPFHLYFNGEFGQLSARDRSERFSGFLSMLSSFTSEPLRRIFNPERESELKLDKIFSENIPVIIRVPGEAYGDLSARIVHGFMKALPVLLSRRREEINRKDYFILLDEGCSYATETMSELCKKAGSAGVKILVTRMADADFEGVATGFLGKMLSSFSVFVCFQTMDPDTRETLARLSMTVIDVKFTKKMSGGEETGDASLRDVQRFNIHPSEFGRLKTGECFIIAPSLQIFEKVKLLPAGGQS